jgi:hypothetical protein
MHLQTKLLIHTANSQYLPHRIALQGSRPLAVGVVLLDGDHAAVVVVVVVVAVVVETAVLHNHLLLVVWSGMQVPKAAC